MSRAMKAAIPTILAASLACLVAPPVLAQGKGQANIDPLVLSRPGPVGWVVLAQDLFLQGLIEKDALALVQAARMLARVGVIEMTDRQPEEKGKRLKAEGPAPQPLPDPETTLKVAETLAQGDDVALSAIDATRAETAVPRGAVRRATADIGPGGIQVWTLDFFGKTTAELAILGNGQSTFSIEVADETGHPACATEAAADRLYCRFAPAENGTFTITVTNRGPAAEAYWLITN